jgi:hypothetical protein
LLFAALCLGLAAGHASAFEPVLIAGNYITPHDDRRPLIANTWFSQRLIVRNTGLPDELGVEMGAGDGTFNACVEIRGEDREIFHRCYDNLKARPSDGATVVSLQGIRSALRRGEEVSILIRPDRSIKAGAMTADNPDWPRGPSPFALRFS